MARYLTRPWPRCNGYVGIVIREPGGNVPVQAVNRRCTQCSSPSSTGKIERCAGDERNFVKKGVNWALRSIGRRNSALQAAAAEVAGRLANSPQASARWVGKDALREFAKHPR